MTNDECSKRAINVTLSYPAAVRRHVEVGVCVAELELDSDYDASGWLADQQARLHEQVGMLALRETRLLHDRVQASYTDYGVDVRDLVAEC
jgi:hypothetical protein